jgi:hypothetical protein
MSRVPSSVARLFNPRTLKYIPNTAATCLGVTINPFAACFAFLINPCGLSFQATVGEEFYATHPHSQHRVHQTGTDLKDIYRHVALSAKWQMCQSDSATQPHLAIEQGFL